MCADISPRKIFCYKIHIPTRILINILGGKFFDITNTADTIRIAIVK